MVKASELLKPKVRTDVGSNPALGSLGRCP